MLNVALPLGEGDITRVNLAIDAMQTRQLTPAQRRDAAFTVCVVMQRRGDPPEVIAEVLAALELTVV
jgi:hypothetical protein